MDEQIMDEEQEPSKAITVRVNEMMLAEYPALQDSWKTLMSLRFGALAFTITLLSIVLGVYQSILSHLPEHFGLGKYALVIIAVFGIVSTAIMWFIEEQTRNMCGACLERGKYIEEVHGVPKAILIGSGSLRRF